MYNSSWRLGDAKSNAFLHKDRVVVAVIECLRCANNHEQPTIDSKVLQCLIQCSHVDFDYFSNAIFCMCIVGRLEFHSQFLFIIYS